MQRSFKLQNISPFKQYVYMFALTVGIQTFHMIEHVAQLLQKFALDSPAAHGLIGSFDVEQVHFSFNLLYLGTLVYVTLGWLNFGSRVCRHQKMMGMLLVAGVVAQSYHMVEHSVKLAQFFATGAQGTPGILGAHIDGAIFHAAMNTLVFLPAVVVFICSGMYRHIWAKETE